MATLSKAFSDHPYFQSGPTPLNLQQKHRGQGCGHQGFMRAGRLGGACLSATAPEEHSLAI